MDIVKRNLLHHPPKLRSLLLKLPGRDPNSVSPRALDQFQHPIHFGGVQLRLSDSKPFTLTLGTLMWLSIAQEGRCDHGYFNGCPKILRTASELGWQSWFC